MQDTYSVDNIDLTYIDNLVGTEVPDGADISYLENEAGSEDYSGEYVSEPNEQYSDYSSVNYDTDYSQNSGEYYGDNPGEVDSLYSEEGSVEGDGSESVFYPTAETNTTAQPQGGGRTIDVDSDFGGNLESAIASANNGDVVVLGSNRYYTSGLTLDKDITIDGREGAAIDGGGTANSVIKVTPGASNATIQNIEITNANNGISGNGASNLTLQNLEIHNIGVGQPSRYGDNNTGISLSNADGIQIKDSRIYNVGRKGIGIGATQGGLISNVTVQDVNLDAQHAQSHDAAGIKFYNTNDVTVSGSYLSDINANHIWNDTTSNTKIEGNTIENVGSDFIAPGFNDNVEISGIYNEKSHNSSVRDNTVTANDGFSAFNATAFSSQTMDLGYNNFSSMATETTDYWTNQAAETQIATTTNPADANFSLFSDQYYGQANIG